MSLRKTFASRLRSHRERQGKSQAVIAGLAGLNAEYVGQIERGHRTPSLDSVEALAEALAVPVTKLLDGAGEPAFTPAVSLDVPQGLGSTLHSALLGSADMSHQKLQPPAVRDQVNNAWNIWQGAPDRYSQITPLITPLITNIVMLCDGSPEPDSWRVASDAYGLLRTVARRINRPDLALLAADRGIRTSEQSDDPVRIATARWNNSHALLALGEHDAAQENALRAISDISSMESREANAITGALWLTTAVAIARSGDKFRASELITGRAHKLAQKTGETNVGRTCFGPTNVALHAISIEIEDGQAATALSLADQVDGSLLASRERHTTWSLDLARGHMLRSEPGEAMLHLLQAETTGAEDLRYNTEAHETIRRVLHQARPSLRSQAVGLTRRLGLEESILAG